MRIDDDWNHYRYTYGEPPREAHVRFDVARALQPTPDTHGHCVCVRVAGPAEGFEDALCAALADVDCWLVGVLGYQDGTTWVLQVEDRAGLQARRAALEQQAPVQWQETPGWDFFEDRVCPTERDWQRIGDREQLERLAAAGADLELPQPVHHAFFGPADALEPLRAQLAPEGFTVAEQSERRLVLVSEHPPADISSRTVALAKLAREHGALYDGWKLPR